MTQYLPPNLLALFAPREPIPYLPPPQKLPHEKKTRGYSGVGQFLSNFEDPKDTPLPTRLETREERYERKRRERAEQAAYKLEQGIALWEPMASSNATSDPYKSLFVARINYDTTETKLRREFEAYGPIKKIVVIQDKVSGKPRGYAFIEFEHEREMHSAYKHADGKKIDGKRVLVDVERGRTVKGWLPRRLGGGLGGTRKGAPDENVRHSGRDDRRSADRERYDEKRRHSRDRSERSEKDRSERRRSRSKDRDREREKRRRSKSRDRERERGDRDKDRDRKSRYESHRRSDRSRSARDPNFVEEQAGGDGTERIRSQSRDKDFERVRVERKRRKSRSHSRDRKRSHRNDYENNNRNKNDSIRGDVKEEPEDGLYANHDMYENESYSQSGFGDNNSNSNSYDQFSAQNYSQPTYVAYNAKEELYSP